MCTLEEEREEEEEEEDEEEDLAPTRGGGMEIEANSGSIGSKQS
jgi:hypothetical protein